jgi:hypothetical protein
MGSSAATQPPRLSRRRVLKVGVLAALALGGVAGILRSRGYAVPPGQRLLTLSGWQFVVLQHAARRIAAPDREDGSVPSTDDLGVAGFVDAWLARMRSDVRRDFGRFLTYLEHLAPLREGFGSRFTKLGAEAQDRVLAATEASSNDLLRAGFDGLKSLVLMGYYADPRTWGILDYDGPLVGRPTDGWRGAP